MYITRIQIEEGFLDGLDISLTSGLNVVIGARGTGKTSLIELIRFCLGAEGNTAETSRKSRDHALSVLAGGQITLTLKSEAGEIYVSRSASDLAPRSSATFIHPIIFSQTEIETVGLQASGRLQLIDGFVSVDTSNVQEKAVAAEFASSNVELEKIRRELEDLERQLATQEAIQIELLSISEAEAALSQTSQVIADKTGQIEVLSKIISQHGVTATEGERINNSLASWYDQIKNVHSNAPTNITSFIKQNFPYASDDIEKAQAKLTEAMEIISTIFYRIKGTVDTNNSEKITKEDQTRIIRKDVEGLSEGAGQILRRGQQLREQQAKLRAISEYRVAKRETLQILLAKRNAALDKLDAIRNNRFAARKTVVDTLNARLGPRIRIDITRAAQVHAFAAVISDSLKGSNLRYAEISKSIAENLSPRALLDAIDSFDQILISQVADITNDRAVRILSHLRTTDLGRLGSFEIEDNVTFQLLDGKDFKDFGSLSTGQRCTVVLPMVLAHGNNVIIVDQPEDHIDNAFIADTLIQAIIARNENTQILFSTHNPNIPVLGNADHVIHLSSDGRHGFCLTAGDLNNLEVVEAVSNVMEGGAKAFERRSKFYSSLDF